MIEGNLIGTDITGGARLPALPGDQNGIGVLVGDGATDNTIGGTTAAARNIISGELNGPGVDITGSSTSDNVVEGNYIGTNLSGTAAISGQRRSASDRLPVPRTTRSAAPPPARAT